MSVVVQCVSAVARTAVAPDGVLALVLTTAIVHSALVTVCAQTKNPHVEHAVSKKIMGVYALVCSRWKRLITMFITNKRVTVNSRAKPCAFYARRYASPSPSPSFRMTNPTAPTQNANPRTATGYTS